MPKFCKECGEKVDAGTKFCPDCGTKVEPDKANPTEGKEDTSLHLGKVMAGGDISQDFSQHHQTTVHHHDDTKEVMTCVVSGRKDTVTEGAICGSCGKWAHKRHFDPKKGECEKCLDTKSSTRRQEYETLFRDCISDDDKIDDEERSVLEEEAKRLGLSAADIAAIENRVRKKSESHLFSVRSPEEEIRFMKAKEALMKRFEVEKAYKEFKSLAGSLRKDREVINYFLLAAIKHGPQEAIEILENNIHFKSDSPDKFFLKVMTLEQADRSAEASAELKKALYLYPDDSALKAKSLERLVDLYLSDEQEDWQLSQMDEYAAKIDLPKNAEDPYVQFVNGYYRMAKDADYPVDRMLSDLNYTYYARIKNTVASLLNEKKRADMKKAQEEERRKTEVEEHRKAEEKEASLKAAMQAADKRQAKEKEDKKAAQDLIQETQREEKEKQDRKEMFFCAWYFVLVFVVPCLIGYDLLGHKESYKWWYGLGFSAVAWFLLEKISKDESKNAKDTQEARIGCLGLLFIAFAVYGGWVIKQLYF